MKQQPTPQDWTLRKIICKKPDESKNDSDQTDLVRLEGIMQHSKNKKGFLRNFSRIQIDHSAN